MNGQSAQQNPSILTQPPVKPIRSVNRIIIPIVTLLLGFFLGAITLSVLPFGKLPFFTSLQKTTVTSPSSLPKPTIDESRLPISFLLLTNPIVYEWRGSVKGKITKKDEHTFTLVDDKSNTITITDLPPNGGVFKTRFFNKINEDQKLTSLKDIPLGSSLWGDFFIFKGGPIRR